MVMRIAKNAAYKVSAIYPDGRDDLEQELILHVLDKYEMFRRYVSPRSTMPLKKRENSLYVSLVRYGHKHLNISMDTYKHELGPIWIDTNLERGTYTHTEGSDSFEDASYLYRLPYNHPYESMDEETILSLLPFIALQDTDIPDEDIEGVAIVRSAVFSCTPEQQDVLVRIAAGMNFHEIAEDLGKTESAVKKRYQRAALTQRCDRPVMRDSKAPIGT
jgi:hypothetical protein